MDNGNLQTAKGAKQDEFYTQLSDIEKELKHYKEQFKDKVVYCNCDDPYESNFFKYFILNFNELGLKSLITTSYTDSPIANKQLTFANYNGKRVYKVKINKIQMGDGAINLTDVKTLLTTDENTHTLLKGNGDFRSDECIDILKEADIVVTNPPFSLFREYVAQLMEYEKKFLIIGNINAVTYKEIFPLIKENKVWIGISIHSGDREFKVPDDYTIRTSNSRIGIDGTKYVRVAGIRWFTNLDISKRHEPLTLYQIYNTEAYPKYDNYGAIEVSKVANIPMDYGGVMGVPITFLDKYCPEQFKIIGDNRYHDGQDFVDDINFINGKNVYRRILIRRI